MTTTAPKPEALAAPAPPAPPADDRDRFFRTDHLMADLKGRTVRGGAVTMAAQGVKFILQMGSTMILARLLTPADFGLVAMVTAITGFVAMFKDAGLSMATVQREHITHGQVSTLFWINVGLSAVLMAVTAGLAPVVAWFYAEPRLLWITLAIAGTFLFSGLTIQHQALLRRQMQFKKLAVIGVAAQAAGIAVAATIAWFTRSYWSLVAMGATMALVTAVLTWLLTGWTPSRPARRTGIRPMLRFGGNLTGFSFVNYFARNADNVLIGWWWGAGPLGFYTKAYGLLTMPLRQLNGPVSAVAVPALSRLQSDPERYRRAYLGILKKIGLIAVPGIVLAAGFADILIPLVLGDGWEPAVRLFRWLALIGLIQVFVNTVGWLYTTQDRTGEMFRAGTLSAFLAVLSFAAGLPWGAEGVAMSYVLTSIIVRTPINIYFAGRRGPVSIRDLGATIGVAFLTGSVVYVLLSTLRIVTT